MGRSIASLYAQGQMQQQAQASTSTSTASFDPECHTYAQKPFDHLAEMSNVVFEAFLPLEPCTSLNHETNEEGVLSRLGRALALNESQASTMPLDLCPTSPPDLLEISSSGDEFEEDAEISPSPSSGVFHARTLDLPLELPPLHRRGSASRFSALPILQPETDPAPTTSDDTLSTSERVREAERAVRVGLERSQSILNILQRFNDRRRETESQRQEQQSLGQMVMDARST